MLFCNITLSRRSETIKRVKGLKSKSEFFENLLYNMFILVTWEFLKSLNTKVDTEWSAKYLVDQFSHNIRAKWPQKIAGIIDAICIN